MPVATPPTTAPTSPSKGRVFAMRLLSTIILWCLLYAACTWRSNALFIGISAFFGLGTAAEYFRLLKHDSGSSRLPRPRVWNWGRLVVCDDLLSHQLSKRSTYLAGCRRDHRVAVRAAFSLRIAPRSKARSPYSGSFPPFLASSTPLSFMASS